MPYLRKTCIFCWRNTKFAYNVYQSIADLQHRFPYDFVQTLEDEQLILEDYYNFIPLRAQKHQLIGSPKSRIRNKDIFQTTALRKSWFKPINLKLIIDWKFSKSGMIWSLFYLEFLTDEEDAVWRLHSPLTGSNFAYSSI